MAYFSPATKEITAKIVYYGPRMCGKTTNLQKVHELMMPSMLMPSKLSFARAVAAVPCCNAVLESATGERLA